MRRRSRIDQDVAGEDQIEAFVHSSRQADLAAVLAEYTMRSESLSGTPQGFRARSIGALTATDPDTPTPAPVLADRPS